MVEDVIPPSPGACSYLHVYMGNSSGHYWLLKSALAVQGPAQYITENKLETKVISIKVIFKDFAVTDKVS